jgi:hypothetical protein
MNMLLSGLLLYCTGATQNFQAHVDLDLVNLTADVNMTDVSGEENHFWANYSLRLQNDCLVSDGLRLCLYGDNELAEASIFVDREDSDSTEEEGILGCQPVEKQ